MDVSKYFVLSLIINLYLILPSNSWNVPELEFVQILYRHGDRAPVALYPTDPNPEHIWVEGLGKLTMLGRLQHYALGKFLRKMYEHFVTSNPTEIFIQSSECDRCMKSAAANLASFYAPEPEWKFEEDVNWQPLSIYYLPKEEDKFLESGSYCPVAFEEQQRIVDSPEGQKIIETHQDMFDYLSAYSGTRINNWTTASYLFDTLFIEDKYNLTIPPWARTAWNELKNVSNWSFFWSFNSPLLLRLRAGPLIGRMVQKIRWKISGRLPLQKVQIYSAHDTNVALVMQALKVYNNIAPPYCAALLLELYSVGTSYSVRLLYLNSSTPELESQVPEVLILNGCTEYCPLDYFENYTKNLIPKDWDEECKIKVSFLEQLSETTITTALIFATLAIVIIMMCSYGLWRLQYRGREKYSYHLMAPLQS